MNAALRRRWMLGVGWVVLVILAVIKFFPTAVAHGHEGQVFTDFKSWRDALALGATASLRTQHRGKEALMTLTTLGPLSASEILRVEKLIRMLIAEQRKAAVSDDPSERDLVRDAHNQHLLASHFAQLEALQSGRYWTLPSGRPRLPRSDDDVTIGVVPGIERDGHAGTVQVVFPLIYDEYPALRDARDYRRSVGRLYEATSIEDFNSLPVAERRARIEAHREAIAQLQTLRHADVADRASVKAGGKTESEVAAAHAARAKQMAEVSTRIIPWKIDERTHQLLPRSQPTR